MKMTKLKYSCLKGLSRSHAPQRVSCPGDVRINPAFFLRLGFTMVLYSVYFVSDPGGAGGWTVILTLHFISYAFSNRFEINICHIKMVLDPLHASRGDLKTYSPRTGCFLLSTWHLYLTEVLSPYYRGRGRVDCIASFVTLSHLICSNLCQCSIICVFM